MNDNDVDEPTSAVSVADVITAGCIGCLFWLVGGGIMILLGAWVCC